MSRLNQAKARRQLARDGSGPMRIILGIEGMAMTPWQQALTTLMIFDETQHLSPMRVSTRRQDWTPRQRPLIWREPQ